MRRQTTADYEKSPAEIRAAPRRANTSAGVQQQQQQQQQQQHRPTTSTRPKETAARVAPPPRANQRRQQSAAVTPQLSQQQPPAASSPAITEVDSLKVEEQQEPSQRGRPVAAAGPPPLNGRDNELDCATTDDQEELINRADDAAPYREHQPPPPLPYSGLTSHLVYAVLASAVGSSFQHGYNGGVVNAPQRLIGQFINETYHRRHNEYATETQVDFVISLIVAIFCIGGCLGAMMTAFVADRLGRKDGLMYNNLLVLVAAPMMASARSMSSYELLILGRFIIGLNAGLNAGLAPLYLNEIAPVQLRGALGTIYQLVITISILLSNIFGLPALLGDSSSWPILFALPIVPAAFMLVALPNCFESPKFLLLNQGRELQAQQALAWFRQTADVQEEMDELRNEKELQAAGPNSGAVSLRDMLSQTNLRKPLVIAIVIMLSQQLSGINAILFFSTSIFHDAGLSEHAAVRATLGMSLTNVIMTLVSLFLVDRAGRRTLHMTGLMGMAATCVVLAICLSGSPAEQTQLSSSLAVVSVYVFIAMFASGPGAIPWFLVAELFPSNARPLASSIAVAVNWLANFLVSLCFLPLTNILHGFTFILFAILLVIFYLFTYYKVPETKGTTAEEISALFKR